MLPMASSFLVVSTLAWISAKKKKNWLLKAKENVLVFVGTCDNEEEEKREFDNDEKKEEVTNHEKQK
jgi:hypothetical protein